jgi:hypothetical protein
MQKTALVMFISLLATGSTQAVYGQVPRQTGVSILQPKPAPTTTTTTAPATTTTTTTAPKTTTTGSTTTTSVAQPWTPPPGRLPDALPQQLALAPAGFQVNQVPEPGTLLLIGAGVIGLMISRRRNT